MKFGNPASAYARAVHVDNFHSEMLSAILKCLAEATRICLAQSFSRNRSDRMSLERRDANRHCRGVFYETAENH